MANSSEQIAAFCINLDRRTDRWSHFCDQIKNIGWEVERVSAVERRAEGDDRLSGPEACTQSHRKVWEMAASVAQPIVAVFEDDAVFPSDFGRVFEEAFSELPNGWRIWHLHSFGPSQKIEPAGRHITKLRRHGWGSHGYLITKGFAKELLELSSNVTNVPVDILLTRGMQYLGVTPYGVSLESTLCVQSGDDTDIPESTQKRYWSSMRDLYLR